jgi:hypothetical protein
MSDDEHARSGSFFWGLFVSFGVYLIGIVLLVTAVFAHVPGTGLELVGLAGIGVSAAVSIRASNRGHRRTAAGAALGTLLWPALVIGLIVWAVSGALSKGPVFVF